MAKIRGYVLDSETESPIPDVAIYLLDGSGNTTGVLAKTDANGDYEFDQPAFGTKVQFDFPGYAPNVVDPAYIGASGKIMLEQDASGTLGGVVIKSTKKKVAKPNYTLPIALGSASLITFGIFLYKVYA